MITVPNLVIFATFFTAYVLEILRLPSWLHILRPDWVVLVLLYWVIALPHRVGLLTACIAGMFLDVVQGDVLGQNSLALLVTTYMAYRLHMRVRAFPIWQQCGSVLMLVGIYLLVLLLLQQVLAGTAWSMSYWLSALTSALVWPLLSKLLKFLQEIYQIY